MYTLNPLAAMPLRKRTHLLIFGIILFAAVVGITVAWQSSTPYSLTQGQQFTNAGRQVLSISPDGSQIVYVANNSLYLKRTAEREARLVEGTAGQQAAITNPVFSPDGRSIAYWSGQDQSLKRIPAAGGTPVTICQAANPYGMSWNAGDVILFGQGTAGIRRVPASGGTPETIVTVKAGEVAHGPQLLPDGNTLLYTLASNANSAARGIPPGLETLVNEARGRGLDVNAILASLNQGQIWDNARIVVQSLKTNETKVLIDGGSDARYAPTGHLVYGKAGTLMAVRFNPDRLEVSGTPVRLIEGVRNAGTNTGTTQFSFSNNGTLIYLAAATSQPSQQRQFAFVDMAGKVTLLRHTPASIFGPRISPDGKYVAYRDGGAAWIADLMSEAPPRRLTPTEPGEAPIWSPDGQRIAFISIFNGQEALFWRRSDGSGSAELLADRARAPESWAADNQSFTFITLVGPSGDAGDYDIWSYSIKDRKATPLIVIPNSAQSGSRLSPDGKWIAYESNETGRAEVYVEPLPRNGQRYPVSKTGGARPVWAPDMSKLYFDNNAGLNARMLSVNVKTQPSFTASEPETLPMKDFIQPSGTIRRQFDITADGKQFLVMTDAGMQTPRIEIIANWFDQLKGLSR